MPYARSLQTYVLPEFYADAPSSWARRLDDISPAMPNLDRLVFRKFEPTEPDGSDRGWGNSDKPQWVLYTAKPIRMVDAERATQFEKHWSEVPEAQQAGLQGVVSDYQHFMWHARGLYVKPFLILQGQWGGTPCKYTRQEEAFLKGSGAMFDPYPLGMFEAIPFDERVVKQISLRDRLLQVSGSYERLERMDTSASKRLDEETAEYLKRETVLDTFREMIQPSVEFLKSWKARQEVQSTLPRAPAGLSDTLSQWKDHYRETGQWMKSLPASQRRVQVAINPS